MCINSTSIAFNSHLIEFTIVIIFHIDKYPPSCSRDGPLGAVATCCSHERDSKGKPKQVWRSNGKACSGVVSLSVAEAFCAESGARICNLTDLPHACSTGCGYDHSSLTWTNTPSRGCTDYPLSEAECEQQLRSSNKCFLRQMGKLTDGQCARTCGLCTNHVDDWAVTQCKKECDAAWKVNKKIDSYGCKIGCNYFVRGPPSLYTGEGGKFFYGNTATKRLYPPGPTDYWVGLEAASVVDCKQACDIFTCRHGTYLNQAGKFPTECSSVDDYPVVWWSTAACNLGCDLAAITKYNVPNRTVPNCAREDFEPVAEDCRCAEGAPVVPYVKESFKHILRSPLAELGWAPPVVDCEAGRFCYQDFDADRVRCHARKKVVYGWARQFVSKEKCPRECGLEEWTLFGEVLSVFGNGCGVHCH